MWRRWCSPGESGDPVPGGPGDRLRDRSAAHHRPGSLRPLPSRLHGGLAADDAPRVVEGEWGLEKVVLLSFADEAAFDRFARSPEYERISVDRKAGSVSVVLLVEGVDTATPPA